MDKPNALSPQELANRGKAAYQKDDFINAALTFEAAAAGYTSAGLHPDAAEMRNNASVAYLQADEAEKALAILEGTAEFFEQTGDKRRQGMSIGNRAAALEELDRLEEAAEAYRLSAQLLHEAGEHQLRADVMHSLSALQFRTGKQLQALATMKTGLDDIEKPSPRQRMLRKLLNIPFDMLNKNAKK